MTPDERAQLIEDIQRSAKFREHIVEQARVNGDFDIADAWAVLDELDNDINQRIMKARLPK